MKKRKTILILFGLILAMTAASCGSTGRETPSSSAAESVPSGDGSESVSREGSAGDPETEPTAYDIPAPDIPELDYGGKEFRILAPHADQVWFYWSILEGDEFLYSDGLNGEVVNDAVFGRNLKLEEKFNIKIRKQESETVVDDSVNLVSGGDDTIDLIYAISSDIGDFIPSGYYADWCQVPYIDFSQEYWYQLAIEGLGVNGRLWMVPSDITMSALSGTTIVYFNKRILADYDLDSPYDLVRDNAWTLDSYLSMIRQVSKDLNGDGLMDVNDLYGIGTYFGRRNGTFMQLTIGSGELITSQGQDGGRYISLNGEKVQSIIDRTRALFKDPAFAIDCDAVQKQAGTYDMTPFFANGHFLFLQGMVSCMQKDLREMEDDFGIAPNPKYDSEQESYYHRANPHAAMFLIPMTAPDPEKTGAFLQYATWLSHSTVLPAYYEITIKQKRTRDPDAVEMLDIIHDTIFFDFSDVYNTNISNYLDNAYESGSYERSFGSMLKKMSKTMTRIISKLMGLD